MKLKNFLTQNNKNRIHGRKVTRFLLLRYVLTLLVVYAFFLVFVFSAWRICHFFIWYESDPMYQALNWIDEHLIYIGGTFSLITWVGITYYFLSKPFQHLQEIIAASEQLAQLTETPIVLPDSLKNVQDELNMVREQAILNARAAREAEQRKNDLIMYLAHDLKTPLTSIIGYLTLLQDEPQISPEMRARYVGITLEKAERLETLINEFFDITRFNLTVLTLETEKISISRMLEQITSEFYPVLAEKNLRWDTQIPPNIDVICDPDKLERVFDNLIRNAVNYSYAGTEIFLSLAAQNDKVEILVRNHGKTISPEKLERIFDQFFRLDSSRSSSTGGAGLGLAIAKEIIELHGGNIKAESAGEIITFTVRLPVRKS